MVFSHHKTLIKYKMHEQTRINAIGDGGDSQYFYGLCSTEMLNASN